MSKWLDRARLARDRSLTLGTVLERLAAVRGSAALVEEAGVGRLTVAGAADRVARMADGVAGLIEPGDRVVIATPNVYDQLLLCLAASRAGGLAVPVNPQMTEAEVDHVIRDSGATLVVRDAGDVLGPGNVALRSAVPASPDDVAAVFYTSGTTGKPKGVRLTHRSLLSSAPAVLLPTGLRRDEAVVALPVAHIMGFAVLLGFMLGGVPTFFLPRFRPDDVLDAIEQRRATMFVGVPAMYRMLLEAGAEQRDLRSIRVWASGADVMPRELARRFQRMGATATLPVVHASVGEAAFVEGYGMVELGGGAAVKFAPPNVPLPVGDFLVPVPPYRFRVVDDEGNDVAPGQVGELLVRGPGVLEGYHGDAAATAAVRSPDGWLRTGDLVRRGPLGVVTFAGREKDVIKTGGYSVYAPEVQQALEEHPDVVEAAAVGIPDDRTGEQVAAAVLLRSGATVAEEELLAFARDRLSEYKAPRRIRIVDELPRTGTTKVKRAEVRALFET